MSDLRHPNIIQFLGLCFLQDHPLPLLVTEKLRGNLHSLLETVPNIPLLLKRSLLEDIARGLHYLHNFKPSIIHRDLTARNVVYTSSLVAKIADVSNTRLVNLRPRQLARMRGTLVYMPPEASRQNSPKLDIFSFGHLALFVLAQVCKVQHIVLIMLRCLDSIPCRSSLRTFLNLIIAVRKVVGLCIILKLSAVGNTSNMWREHYPIILYWA